MTDREEVRVVWVHQLQIRHINILTYPVFGFHLGGMFFFVEKTEKQYSVPDFPQERLYLFLSSNVPFPQKWSRLQKLFFTVILEKYCFFFSKKLLNEN